MERPILHKSTSSLEKRGSVFHGVPLDLLSAHTAKSGLITVQPAYFKKLSAGLVARWQTRWFWLSNSYLLYAADEEDAGMTASGDACATSIDLRRIESVTDASKGGAFEFNVVGEGLGSKSGERLGVFRVRVNSKAELDLWLSAMRQRQQYVFSTTPRSASEAAAADDAAAIGFADSPSSESAQLVLALRPQLEAGEAEHDRIAAALEERALEAESLRRTLAKNGELLVAVKRESARLHVTLGEREDLIAEQANELQVARRALERARAARSTERGDAQGARDAGAAEAAREAAGKRSSDRERALREKRQERYRARLGGGGAATLSPASSDAAASDEAADSDDGPNATGATGGERALTAARVERDAALSDLVALRAEVCSRRFFCCSLILFLVAHILLFALFFCFHSAQVESAEIDAAADGRRAAAEVGELREIIGALRSELYSAQVDADAEIGASSHSARSSPRADDVGELVAALESEAADEGRREHYSSASAFERQVLDARGAGGAHERERDAGEAEEELRARVATLERALGESRDAQALVEADLVEAREMHRARSAAAVECEARHKVRSSFCLFASFLLCAHLLLLFAHLVSSLQQSDASAARGQLAALKLELTRLETNHAKTAKELRTELGDVEAAHDGALAAAEAHKEALAAASRAHARELAAHGDSAVHAARRAAAAEGVLYELRRGASARLLSVEAENAALRATKVRSSFLLFALLYSFVCLLIYSFVCS